MKADIEITIDQINRILDTIGEEVSQYKLFEGGFINPIYEITTKSNLELILRITNPLPKWTKWKTRNEIEVMSFLRNKTSIPIPTLYSSSDTKELIGHEYLLMEKALGTPMHQFYPEASLETKYNLISELILYVAQMQTFSFSQIGCFRHGFSVGAIPDIEAGPFNTITSFLSASIRNRVKELEQIPRFLHFLPRLRSFLASLDEREIEPRPFVLNHMDLEAKNILINEGKISAVLDFEWAGSFPDYHDASSFSHTFQIEHFPQVKEYYLQQIEDYHIPIEIPENLQDFEAIESLAMCLVSYPAWFIGKEQEAEEFAVECHLKLHRLLKKYGC
jgi:aminoglycoside phosphotransferase (APT) family kinase protein